MPGFSKRLVLCLWCCLHIQTADSASEYIYAPVDALAVNAKTVLVAVSMDLTWNEAVNVCKSKFSTQGGTLAKIDSSEANRLMAAHLGTVGKNAWFGLYWRSTSSLTKLRWADRNCTEFNTKGFQNFMRGEETFKTSDRCYYLEQDSGYWRRVQCRSTNYAICEYLEFSTTPCSNSPFDFYEARFYTIQKTNTNAEQCQNDCLSIQGCFLTWPSDRMCLIGVVDQAGSTYVRSRCFQVTTDARGVTFTRNDEDNPRECQRIDMTSITGANVAAYNGSGSFGGSCSASGVTQTVVSTVVATMTTTDVRMMTTTVTDVHTLTTTEVSTTTTIDLVTTTVVSTVAMTIEPECTAPHTVIIPTTVTEISVSVQPTTTTYISVSIQPTTTTYVSISIQPTTTTFTSYINCDKHTPGFDTTCSTGQTVTKERILYVTPTMNSCPETSCPVATSVAYSTAENLPIALTKTVTYFDCTATTTVAPSIKTVDRSTVGEAVTKTVIMTSAIRQGEEALTSNCHAVATTVVSEFTTTQTLTSKETCGTVTSTISADCVVTTIGQLLTTTETWTATPVYHTVTQTVPNDCTAEIRTAIAGVHTTLTTCSTTPAYGVVTKTVTENCASATTISNVIITTETLTASTCDIMTQISVTDCTATTAISGFITTTETRTATLSCNTMAVAVTAECTATTTVENLLTTTETQTATTICDVTPAFAATECPPVPSVFGLWTTTKTSTATAICDTSNAVIISATDCTAAATVTVTASGLVTTETSTITPSCDITAPALTANPVAVITATTTLTAASTCDFITTTITADCVAASTNNIVLVSSEAWTPTPTCGQTITTVTADCPATHATATGMISTFDLWKATRLYNTAATTTNVVGCTTSAAMPSVVTTTETWTAIPSCNAKAPTLTVECSSTPANFAMFTKTETWTVTPTCEDIKRSVVPECTMPTNISIPTETWTSAPICASTSLTHPVVTDYKTITTTSILTATETWTHAQACDATLTLTADCEAKTSIPSLLTVRGALTETPSSSLDCTQTQVYDNVRTITETWTEMHACGVITPTSSHGDLTTNDDVVTPTATSRDGNTPQTSSNLMTRSVNEPDNGQEIDDFRNSLIQELLVPRANLSSRRRLKESIEDNRITAKVPGIFACCFLGCVFGLLVLLDVTALVRDLSRLGKNLTHTSSKK